MANASDPAYVLGVDRKRGWAFAVGLLATVVLSKFVKQLVTDGHGQTGVVAGWTIYLALAVISVLALRRLLLIHR